MRNFFYNVLRFLQNVFFFILGLIFSFVPTKKKKKEKNNTYIKNEASVTSQPVKVLENNTMESSSSGVRERFSESLKYQPFLDVKILEEEILEVTEKIYSVTRNEILQDHEQAFKKYQKKIVKKVLTQSESFQNREDVREFIQKKIEIDKMEKYKIASSPDNTPVKSEQPFFSQKETKKRLNIPYKETLASPVFLEEQTLEPKLQMNEENAPLLFPIETNSLEKKLDAIELVSTPQFDDNENKKIEPILNESVIEELNKIDEPEEKKENFSEVKEVSAIPIMMEPKVDIKQESVLKQEKLSTNSDEKKVQSEENKEPVLAIYLDVFDKEQERIEGLAKNEIVKEEFEEKDYERIEKLIQDKINELEKVLDKPLSLEQKEEVSKKIESFNNLKKKVSLHKESDLEEIRVSLEESIPVEEIDRVKQEIFELQNSRELERLKEIQNKTMREMEQIDALLIKKTLKNTLNKLKLPLFLSFPFIKNKYFRKFVAGVFVFSGLGFIKRVLFGSPLEQIDFSVLQKGNDALSESLFLVNHNLETLNNIKETVFVKYPELKQDEEFLYYIESVQAHLNQSREKLLKQQKTVDKYFDKSKVFVRQRSKIL